MGRDVVVAADEVGRVKVVVVVGRRAAVIVVILVKEFVDRGGSLRGFEFVVCRIDGLFSKGRMRQFRWIWPCWPHPKHSPLASRFCRSSDLAGAYGRRPVASRSMGSWTYRGREDSF
jgi:hypothetical protein